jgi:hypothetical protein
MYVLRLALKKKKGSTKYGQVPIWDLRWQRCISTKGKKIKNNKNFSEADK